MIFELKDRYDLIDLIEEGELISETPSKRETICETLLRKDGKLYMLTYTCGYSDGVDFDSVTIVEVKAKEVTRIDYIPIPGAQVYPPRVPKTPALPPV